MSTNFYLQKDPYGPRHIGKTFFGGRDRGLGFIWAIDPEEFNEVREKYDGEEVEVVDEFDHRMTLNLFLTVLEKVQFYETEHIGKDFS